MLPCLTSSWTECFAQPSAASVKQLSSCVARMASVTGFKLGVSKRIVSSDNPNLCVPISSHLTLDLICFALTPASLHGVLPWSVVNVTLFETTLVHLPTNERASLSNGSLANSRIVNWARRYVPIAAPVRGHNL